MIKKKLSWKPQRRGEIYCSSACGGGCTYEAYERAKSQTEMLAKKLGKGWNATIFENLGWFGKVEKGVVQIFVPTLDSYTGEYTVRIDTHPQFVESSREPILALRKALKRLDSYIKELQQVKEDIGEEF